MNDPIEIAYQSLDEDEREEVDDMANDLIVGFKKRLKNKNRPDYRFGVSMARELLAKTNIFLTHKQPVSRTIYEVSNDC
jgi:arginase family enzyme